MVIRAFTGNAFMYTYSLITKPTTENARGSLQQVSVTASCTIMLCFAKLNSHLKTLKTKCIWDSL